MTKFWDTSLQSPSGWPPKACEACFRSAWASKAMPRRWQKPATTPGLFWTLFSSLYIWVYPISVFLGSLDTNILSIVVTLSVNQTTLNILYNYVWPKGYHILFECCSTNSPRKLAEKVGKGICPECLAGLDDLPFEDVSWNPRWLPSEGLENPWDDDDVSPLLQIPGHTARQHEIFRKDPFHIFKQTVGGHWVASAIVLLSDLGYWSSPGQSNQADVLLEVAYQDFHHFMKNEWQGHHVANIKNFTRALLHWPKIKTFPYGRFKGSDCMLMIRWLAKVIQKGVLMKETNQRQGVSLLDRPLEAWHKPFLQNILLGSTASVEFFRILHTQGVWLSRETSRNLALHCYNFTNSYSGLARLCHGQGLRRFTLEPSLHYFHHYAVDVTARLQAQDSHILSPNQDNCEMDEDFVGRISRLSRAVHASTTTQRTLQRYLIKVWFVLTGQDWGASGSTKRKRKLTRTGGVKKRKHQNQVNNPWESSCPLRHPAAVPNGHQQDKDREPHVAAKLGLGWRDWIYHLYNLIYWLDPPKQWKTFFWFSDPKNGWTHQKMG